MSIIQRENPLNLQYNICIVTSASSPLGVRVCKSLLKANALVLGLDSRARDVTLNAGLGTHFQFLECDVKDPHVPEQVVAAAGNKFGLERIDVLVHVVEKGKGRADLSGVQKLADATSKVMKQQGRGAIVLVVESAEDQDDGIIKFIKDMASRHDADGIRCNAVLPQASGGADTSTAKAFDGAKEHMFALQQSKEVPTTAHQIGLVVGYLSSNLAENVTGRAVHLDGSSSPL